MGRRIWGLACSFDDEGLAMADSAFGNDVESALAAPVHRDQVEGALRDPLDKMVVLFQLRTPGVHVEDNKGDLVENGKILAGHDQDKAGIVLATDSANSALPCLVCLSLSLSLFPSPSPSVPCWGCCPRFHLPCCALCFCCFVDLYDVGWVPGFVVAANCLFVSSLRIPPSTGWPFLCPP